MYRIDIEHAARTNSEAHIIHVSYRNVNFTISRYVHICMHVHRAVNYTTYDDACTCTVP